MGHLSSFEGRFRQWNCDGDDGDFSGNGKKEEHGERGREEGGGAADWARETDVSGERTRKESCLVTRCRPRPD